MIVIRNYARYDVLITSYHAQLWQASFCMPYTGISDFTHNNFWSDLRHLDCIRRNKKRANKQYKWMYT